MKGADGAGMLEHPSAGFYMTASAADIPEDKGTTHIDWSSVWNMELSYMETHLLVLRLRMDFLYGV